MSGMRTAGERKLDALAVLEGQGHMWLATARDGRPHAIGVSAWWDGTDLVVATVGTSRTAQNLRRSQNLRRPQNLRLIPGGSRLRRAHRTETPHATTSKPVRMHAIANHL